MFEAYEADIPWIHINDVVEFTIQAIPGKTFKGKITYVDPFVSSNTRVAKVRVEIKNQLNKLLPEMYASGIIQAKMTDMENKIIIPKSAALWTGKRAVVYVKVPHEKTISFVYREITLGQDMGNFYSVEDGLEEGEIVATNGVFRIDASAQLLGQKSMMNPEGGKPNLGHAGMDMGGDTKKKDSKIKMSNRIKVAKEFKNQLSQVFDQYIHLKDAFANDDSRAAKLSAKEILNATAKVDMKLLTDNEAHNHWMTIGKEVTSSAKSISETTEIEEQRGYLIHLSAHLIKAVKLFGINQKVYEQFCPMADNNNGAYWLSLNEKIKNPYFGAKMLTCGEIKTVIEN